MDAYAAIKLLSGEDVTAPIHSLVNMAANPTVAYEVHGRLARACWRFLGITLASAGHLGVDPRIVAVGATAASLLPWRPTVRPWPANSGNWPTRSPAAAGGDLRPRRMAEALAAVA